MTDTRNNGGPAFPQISELGDIAATSAGMSLRDWFAGQALAAILQDRDHRLQNYVLESAEDAYKYADAMLTARSPSSKEA